MAGVLGIKKRHKLACPRFAQQSDCNRPRFFFLSPHQATFSGSTFVITPPDGENARSFGRVGRLPFALAEKKKDEGGGEKGQADIRRKAQAPPRPGIRFPVNGIRHFQKKSLYVGKPEDNTGAHPPPAEERISSPDFDLS
jgi:hypothetical protein